MGGLFYLDSFNVRISGKIVQISVTQSPFNMCTNISEGNYRAEARAYTVAAASVLASP